MKTTNKTTAAALEIMTAGLAVGESRKLDAAPGVYMAAHVERISRKCFSIAHYYTQNGDAIADPDLVVWRASTGAFVPVSLQQNIGRLTVAVKLENDEPVAFAPGNSRELASFANMMIRNVKSQQGGLAALRKACS
jgi:Domain of unknown function (DUF6908)